MIQDLGEIELLRGNLNVLFFPLDKSDGSAEQAKVIVGVVVGLFIAAALVGLIYWLYIKKSR